MISVYFKLNPLKIRLRRRNLLFPFISKLFSLFPSFFENYFFAWIFNFVSEFFSEFLREQTLFIPEFLYYSRRAAVTSKPKLVPHMYDSQCFTSVGTRR